MSTLVPSHISASTLNRPNPTEKWEKRHTQGCLPNDKINFNYCRFCGGKRFRFSRFRWGDLLELLRFRFPMRCVRCHHRTYRYAFTAFLVRYRKPDLNAVEDTWRSWTGSRSQCDEMVKPIGSTHRDAHRIVYQDAMLQGHFFRKQDPNQNRYLQ